MDDKKLEPIVKELSLRMNIDTKGLTNKEIIAKYFKEALDCVYLKRDLLMEFIADECVLDTEFDEMIEKYLPKIIKLMPKYEWTFLENVASFNLKAIENNIEFLFSKENENEILNIFLVIKNKNRGLDRIINNQIQKNSKLFVRSLWHGIEWEEGKTWEDEFEEKEKEECINSLDYVLREVLTETNRNYTDIEYINEGSYAVAYRIGNRVLKLGDEFAKYKIPNHRRILQPVARANYTLEDRRVMAFFEVTSYVDINFSEEERDEEKLYEIYKELRDSGIVWLDAKWSNVGKLLDENKTTWKGKDVKIAPNSVGFSESYKGEPLKKGELVVIDLDFLFGEYDPTLEELKEEYSSEYSLRFDVRYRREKKQEEAIKVKKDSEYER